MPKPTILNELARREAIARFGFDDDLFNDVVAAFDFMLAGEGDEFKKKIADGNERLGFQGTIPPSERPTAVDHALGVCLHVYCVNRYGPSKGRSPELQIATLRELKQRCELR